jgi:3-hydroxyisobutyrate dehydrogenase-like beta-hydroxyacid dehydrogenase
MSAGNTPTLGWIGLGKMGFPICGNLAKAGFALRVYDIDPARGAALAANKGTTAAASLEGAAMSADIVLSMVPDDAALRAVALGEGGVLAAMQPGSIYVDLSTVSPDVSVEVATEAARRGVRYLRAPVSGSTALAESAGLTVLASGPADAFHAVEAVFSAMARQCHYVGEGDQARYMKLAINHLVGSTAVLVAEALTLGRKGGLDWDTMLTVLGDSVAASPLVKYKLEPLRRRDFAAAFSASQMLKDMSLVAGAGAAAGVDMPAARLVRDRFTTYATGENANKDFFAIVEDVEATASLPPLPTSVTS